MREPSGELSNLPLLPKDDEGPVFAEPWQAQAFATVAELIKSGLVNQKEWADRLGSEFRGAEERGEFNTGERYYDYWLMALERLVVEKKLMGWDDLAKERETIRENDHHRREGQLGHDHGHEH